MGTSTQHERHSTTATTRFERDASSGTHVINSSPIIRRESGGSSANGTSFLNNNNVIVRGRCSPTISRSKKEEDQGTKADATNRDVMASFTTVCSLASSGVAFANGGDDLCASSMSISECRLGSSEKAHSVSSDDNLNSSDASLSVNDMLEENGDVGCCDDDISMTSSSSFEEEDQEDLQALASRNQDHPCHRNQETSQQNTSLTWNKVPSTSQQTMANSSRLDNTASAFVFQHHNAVPFASSSCRHHPPDTKSLIRSMDRIICLNQSAMKHYLAGGDIALAQDALHKAKWIRRHLVDELAVMRSIHGENNNEGQSTDRRLAFANVKMHPDGRSSSFNNIITNIDSLPAMSRPSSKKAKLMKRASFSDDGEQQQQEQRSQHQIPTNVTRSSYIYQRMDFDEGMHMFTNFEAIIPAAFWLPMSSSSDHHTNASADVPLLHQMSPVVEATIAFNFGQVQRCNGDLDSASASYNHALDILQRNGAVCVHPIVIPILHNVGQLQYRRGDVQMAKESYTLALQHAERMYGGQHPHVASALNCLGVLHYHDANSCDEYDGTSGSASQQAMDSQDKNSSNNSNGRSGGKSNSQQQQQRLQPASTRKAMELFQQALSIRIKCIGPDHIDVATVLNNIGRIHVQLDEFDEALEYYEDALRIRRTVLGMDSLDYAATAFNAGQSFHQKGDLTRASELYHEFLRVALIKFGHGHRDVAVVLSGIAQIHQEKHEYEKALELYEASLSAGRLALGEDHSEIAMLLNRMGNFHFERERLGDALKCYTRGLRIERKVLPPDHPNIIVTLSNLGEIHRQRGEWDDAARIYDDCLDTLRKKYKNNDHADVASTLSTIGLIHDQRGDTCLALHYLQDALLMRRRLFGNDSIDVSSTLVYVGTILYRKSFFSVAIELFTESLRIRKAALGNDHRDVAFVLYNIAMVHQQRGCYEEAIDAYSETLRIEKLVLGESHRDVSMTLFKLGEVHKAAGDLEQALKCFKESLSVERSLSSSPPPSENESIPPPATDAGQRRQQQEQSTPGPDHAAMARALNEIGNIHLSRGDVLPMMDAFNESSRMYSAAGLSPNNVIVSEHLYALEFSCPEAAPAA